MNQKKKNRWNQNLNKLLILKARGDKEQWLKKVLMKKWKTLMIAVILIKMIIFFTWITKKTMFS
jgi:hypothetical protein